MKPEPDNKKVVRPPEPQFFDPPEKEGLGGWFQSLFEKRFVRLGAVLALVVIISMLLFPQPEKKKASEPLPVADQKRVLLTTASMERAIEDSAKGRNQNARRTEENRKGKEKRKYDTDIAVFVLEPKSQEKARSSKNEEKGGALLGLPSGTKITSLVSNRIFSFNVAAPVIAVVAKDFIYQDKVVIPEGSEFLGEADILKSLDRINVRFDLLIFPDGRELRVRALALSEDGSGGIKGKVDKHTDRKVLKAVGETLLAGVSLFAGSRQADPFSLEDQMRLNLTQNLTNEAARDLRSTKIEKSVTVEAYTPIQVMLLEAI